jgi:dTDP-4-amino-4,6-dideoxygalactose transaminase
MLKKVPHWIDIRNRNAEYLTNRFEQIPGLRATPPPAHVRHAYYKYYAFLHTSRLKSGWSRDRIMTAIADEGIPCFSGICSEVYREKAFRNMRISTPLNLPIAKELGRTSLMFDVHPELTFVEMDDTAAAVEKVMKKAAR